MAFYEDERGTVQVGALSGSTRRDLYSFSIPMMVLTSVAVALRVYVRGYMTKTFGVEDWLIIPAYVSHLVPLYTSLLTLVGLAHGLVYKCNCHWRMAFT